MSSETEEIPQFRPIDLPYVPLNSDYDSSDLEEATGYSTPNTPVTPSTSTTPSTPTSPSTPATPLSQLATSVTTFGFTEEETIGVNLGGSGESIFSPPQERS